MTRQSTKGGPPAHPPPSAHSKVLRAKIEKAMTKEGWSTDLARRLCKRLEISKSTLYKHRAAVLREWAKHYTIENEDEVRADMLARLHRWQEAAFKAGKFGPLASLARVEVAITGIEAPLRIRHENTPTLRVEVEVTDRWGAPANAIETTAEVVEGEDDDEAEVPALTG